MKRAALSLAVALAAGLGAGCFPAPPGGFAMGGGSRGSGQEARCQQGLDMLTQARCSPGRAGQMRVEVVEMELSNYKQQCPDAKSRGRIADLESTCLPQYYEQEQKAQADRRAVRAKFLDQVSSLLRDPDYPALADRENALTERAFQASRDEAARRELDAVRASLAELARKHGIDPSQARALELW